MAEKNVQELRVGALEGRDQRAAFARRHLPRFVVQLSKPKPPQKMDWPFPNDVNLIEWKLGGVLTLPRDDEWPHPPERADLPVDVQHLRLEKRGAITRNDRTRISIRIQRRTLSSQRGTSNLFRKRFRKA